MYSCYESSNLIIMSSGETVTLPKLRVLKYIDEKGEKQKIDIIKKASHEWKKIADLICKDPNRASALQQQYQDPCDCLRLVLLESFIDNKPVNYSQNWKGLIELLEDAVNETLAKEVKYALSHQVPNSSN